eukprot:COSAG04_NODE_29884_length_266_cov_0.610778_1_plen_88_part_11
MAPFDLLDAVGLGDCGAVAKLVDGGLNVNALVESRSKHPDTGQLVRSTALHVAVLNKQEAVVRLLLDRGADPNLANSLGVTPLMEAAA